MESKPEYLNKYRPLNSKEKKIWRVYVAVLGDDDLPLKEVCLIYLSYLRWLGFDVECNITEVCKDILGKEFRFRLSRNDVTLECSIVFGNTSSKNPSFKITLTFKNITNTELECEFYVREYSEIFSTEKEVKDFYRNFYYVPSIEWHDNISISPEDILTPQDLNKLEINEHLISPRIYMGLISDFNIVNIIILFSCQIIMLYYIVIYIINDLNQHLLESCHLSKFYRILLFSIDKEYLLVRALIREFYKWERKISKLDAFLDYSLYFYLGMFTNFGYTNYLGSELLRIVHSRFEEMAARSSQIQIDSLSGVYAIRAGERAAIFGAVLGFILSVLTTKIILRKQTILKLLNLGKQIFRIWGGKK